MRGVDEESGEYLGPSRGMQRREALAVLDLAGKLVEQNDARLAQLPLSEELRALVLESKKITAQIARKRQVQYLAKIMRREDDATLLAIRSALEFDKSRSRQQTAALHQVEAWRDRLIEFGDLALTDLLAEHPHADRQHLRQLARNAREEKLHNKPPHACRELFRELRELFTEEAEAVEALEAEAEGDDDITHSEVSDFEDLDVDSDIDRDERWSRYE
jgi:ribosome-associated protein